MRPSTYREGAFEKLRFLPVCSLQPLPSPSPHPAMSLSSALRSSRNALPAARSYATQAALAVQQVSGINVASSDDGAPTAAITVVVKAGSRYEGAGPGLAHVLKNSVFKVSRSGRVRADES
jgi:hypothetical protein